MTVVDLNYEDYLRKQREDLRRDVYHDAYSGEFIELSYNGRRRNNEVPWEIYFERCGRIHRDHITRGRNYVELIINVLTNNDIALQIFREYYQLTNVNFSDNRNI